MIENNPDLYGPFWIPTLLIFSLFVSNSLIKSIGNYFNHKDVVYDFNMLPFAVILIYSYLQILPLLIWLICKYNTVQVRFLYLLNVYGYSFSIWIPISVIFKC